MIPDDRFIDVELTPYISRLLHVHGDVTQEEVKEQTPPPAAPHKNKEKN